MKQLLAGVGRCDITPAPGTPQGGWGAQTHQRGIGADMPFYATALVLSDGQETAAIVDVDAIGFDREWTDKILDAIQEISGLKRGQIRFSCTHTHSGPNTFRLQNISEGLDMAVSYMEGLPLRIASAVWQAQQRLQPVRCAAGSGSCDINVNRRFRAPDGTVIVGRNWEGAADPTVRVIRFDDLNENPVATLVHYACHGTTMAWQTQMFTPDFPGPVRKVVEEQMGGMCLFLQGAAANLGPRRGFTGDCRVYRKLGKILGLEASRIAQEIETLPRQERYVGIMQSGAPIALYEDEAVEPAPPVLHARRRVIQLPAKKYSGVAALQAEADALLAEVSRLRREGTLDEMRLANARATQAGWRADNARLYHDKDFIDWELHCIRIGPIALLSIAGEPFMEIAQRIVAQSPFEHTLVCGYTNGGLGYIPTREAYGEGGYEIEATFFSPDAADKLVAEGLRLLRDEAADTAAS
jgi:hypothetical protein